VVALVRDIVQRWGIPKERVVGHSDIAPGRKQDPGPLFPWKRLADEGLALWFDEARAAALRPGYEAELPDRSAGSSKGWRNWVTSCRWPASSTPPRATCWCRSRCASGRRATTASPTPRRRPSWRRIDPALNAVEPPLRAAAVGGNTACRDAAAVG
jgi:hypothetical protein